MATPNNNDPRVQSASDKQNQTAREWKEKTPEQKRDFVEKAVEKAKEAEKK